MLFASGQITAVAEAEAPVVALVEDTETVDEAPVVEDAIGEVEKDGLISFAPQILGEMLAPPSTFFR